MTGVSNITIERKRDFYNDRGQQEYNLAVDEARQYKEEKHEQTRTKRVQLGDFEVR